MDEDRFKYNEDYINELIEQAKELGREDNLRKVIKIVETYLPVLTKMNIDRINLIANHMRNEGFIEDEITGMKNSMLVSLGSSLLTANKTLDESIEILKRFKENE